MSSSSSDLTSAATNLVKEEPGFVAGGEDEEEEENGVKKEQGDEDVQQNSNTPRPLPPPPSTDAWREAYESRRREAMSRQSGGGSLVQTMAVVGHAESANRKLPAQVSSPSFSPSFSSSSSVVQKVDKVIGVMTASVAPRPDRVDLMANPASMIQQEPMSNSKRKKLEEQDLKKTSVQKLIKKVKADMHRPPQNWASEYEARKAAAISGLASGSAEPRVGSMSAFHPGFYGAEAEQEARVSQYNQISLAPAKVSTAPPPSASMARKPIPPAAAAAAPRMMMQSAPLSFPSLPLPSASEDLSNDFKVVGSAQRRRPPPSPLELSRMERQNPQVWAEAAKIAKVECENEVDTQNGSSSFSQIVPSVPASSSSSDSSKTKKVTMAALFRQVKCDAKRSSEDWQVEYETRKRARMEEESLRRANQVMTAVHRSSSSKTSDSQSNSTSTPTKAPNNPPPVRPIQPPAAPRFMNPLFVSQNSARPTIPNRGGGFTPRPPYVATTPRPSYPHQQQQLAGAYPPPPRPPGYITPSRGGPYTMLPGLSRGGTNYNGTRGCLPQPNYSAPRNNSPFSGMQSHFRGGNNVGSRFNRPSGFQGRGGGYNHRGGRY